MLRLIANIAVISLILCSNAFNVLAQVDSTEKSFPPRNPTAEVGKKSDGYHPKNVMPAISSSRSVETKGYIRLDPENTENSTEDGDTWTRTNTSSRNVNETNHSENKDVSASEKETKAEEIITLTEPLPDEVYTKYPDMPRYIDTGDKDKDLTLYTSAVKKYFERNIEKFRVEEMKKRNEKNQKESISREERLKMETK